MNYEDFKNLTISTLKNQLVTADFFDESWFKRILNENIDVIENAFVSHNNKIERGDCEDTEAMWKAAASSASYCLFMFY